MVRDDVVSLDQRCKFLLDLRVCRRKTPSILVIDRILVLEAESDAVLVVKAKVDLPAGRILLSYADAEGRCSSRGSFRARLLESCIVHPSEQQGGKAQVIETLVRGIHDGMLMPPGIPYH